MAEPRFLRLPSSGSLQYSMRHLKSSVVDLGLPDFINKLIPVVEAQFVSPVANTADSGTKTTGTINPGLIYVEKTYQIAVEAFPSTAIAAPMSAWRVNCTSISHDLFPNGIGRPIFSSDINMTRTR